MLAEHDAVLYCGGSEKPRPAGIPGAELIGVHDAMPYLVQQNKRVGGEDIQSVAWPSVPILAGGKHVVVVGGGDTASDCIGTAFRQGAVRVTQLDIRPRPPEKEDKLTVWPYWATKMRTSSSQAEGAEREFQVATLEFVGEDGQLAGVKCCEVDEQRRPVEGTEFVIRADLAFIAIGFAGPLEAGVLAELGDRLATRLDARRSTNVVADEVDYRTSIDKLFAAGDVRRGQSLVVWAIREGRQAAHAIDKFLMGSDAAAALERPGYLAIDVVLSPTGRAAMTRIVGEIVGAARLGVGCDAVDQQLLARRVRYRGPAARSFRPSARRRRRVADRRARSARCDRCSAPPWGSTGRSGRFCGRQRGDVGRDGIAKDLGQRPLGIEGDLALAGAGEVDAVGCAQLHPLAVHVRTDAGDRSRYRRRSRPRCRRTRRPPCRPRPCRCR